jgi:hypothetical protein
MAEQDFWNTTLNQVQDGFSAFLGNEISRITTPKSEPQPDATKSVADSSAAQMNQMMKYTMLIGVGILILALLFGGRRGK